MYCNCTWTESIHNAHVYILVHANKPRNKHINIVKLNQEIPGTQNKDSKDKASISQHIIDEPHKGHVCVKRSDAVCLVHLSFKTTCLLRPLDICDEVSYDLPFIYEQSCRP